MPPGELHHDGRRRVANPLGRCRHCRQKRRVSSARNEGRCQIGAQKSRPRGTCLIVGFGSEPCHSAVCSSLVRFAERTGLSEPFGRRARIMVYQEPCSFLGNSLSAQHAEALFFGQAG